MVFSIWYHGARSFLSNFSIMGLFSSLFRALIFLCLGLLAYDYYQGGEHTTSLVDTIRDRDSLEQVWRDIPLHTDKLVNHANAAWIEIKTSRSPKELIQKFMYKNRGIPKDGDVYILSQYTFDKVVDGTQPVLVKFYAPWCTHCKNLAPAYQRVAEAYKGSGVMIAEVNSQKEGSLTRHYGVKMYPTLLWFPKGVSSTDNGLAEVYAGARDFDAITRFIQEKSGWYSIMDDIKSVIHCISLQVFAQKPLVMPIVFLS